MSSLTASRTTIDFGIDLGTTNSAIAVLKGVVPEIIKNNTDGDITPSSVAIDKRGALQVGQRARNRIIDAPEDAYIEFKRRMGSGHIYPFKSSGQARTPEELSSEILKSLRSDVQQRTGELIEAAVITVPAAFELFQCEATAQAARLAGFKESPLLQEPIAAALAYGFQGGNHKAYWLVYDFGGGTFDAAVVKAEEESIRVVNHGGDNFLGGSDIDWAIVEQLLIPQILEHHLLEKFQRGNSRWQQAFAKLKRAAETAKIDLSRSERTILETCRFDDDSGNEIEFELELTRDHVVRVAEPIISRSVDICKRVLQEKNLDPKAIEKIILVGGPTLAPYFRAILSDRLGIPLDYSVDPLTVVAKGAAVFAGTQRIQIARPPSELTGTYSLDIRYQPVGADENPSVGGRVSGVHVTQLGEYAIEIVNQKTQWRSGRIALSQEGVFMTSVHAARGERNTFQVELFDPQGNRHPIHSGEFHYTVGSVVDEQPLINSIGVALANNQCDRFLEKGAGLPLRIARTFRTTRPLLKGQSSELLRVPLVEGENELADRNRKVGELEIQAERIRRDLPPNSDVEITLSVTTDRMIRITAYIPLLDEYFEGKIDMGKRTVNPEHLQSDFDSEITRFNQVKSSAKNGGGIEAQSVIEAVEQLSLLSDVRQMLVSSKGDPDSAAKCERRLLELKLVLDDAINQVEWPLLTARARNELRDLHKIAQQHGIKSQKNNVSELSDEVDEIIREHKADRLRKKLDQIAQLRHEISATLPEYWVALFRWMETNRQKMFDQPRAALLIQQGKDCIANNNIVMLENVVRQLWSQLPDQRQLEDQRGYQSGLVR